MLDSIKLRQQGIVSSGAATSTLESGILALAMEEMLAQLPHSKERSSDQKYLAAVLDSASQAFTDVEYAAGRPLDRFSLALAVERAPIYNVSISEAASTAYASINASLSIQKRNPDGGLWYYVYPDLSYLDGMVSVLPFMAAASQPNATDIELQLSLLQTHCFQPETSLLVHGYDWSHRAVWAHNALGASPFVWGRSLGWFLMGVVQTYEGLGCLNQGEGQCVACGLMRNMTIQIADSLVRHADPSTGAWWQLTTFPGQVGNYLESSSTVLFIFFLLKGLRTGLIPPQGGSAMKAALKAYSYTTEHFVVDVGTKNGTIGFDKTVAVCSLNSTATYEYYTTQPLVPNSLLGESAFIFASLEVEKLLGEHN